MLVDRRQREASPQFLAACQHVPIARLSEARSTHRVTDGVLSLNSFFRSQRNVQKCVSVILPAHARYTLLKPLHEPDDSLLEILTDRPMPRHFDVTRFGYQRVFSN